MNYFILQSLLLIAVAYFLGAMLGCWLRKMFIQSASVLHRQGDELTMGERATATVAAGAGVNRSVGLRNEPDTVACTPVETKLARHLLNLPGIGFHRLEAHQARDVMGNVRMADRPEGLEDRRRSD